MEGPVRLTRVDGEGVGTADESSNPPPPAVVNVEGANDDWGLAI